MNAKFTESCPKEWEKKTKQNMKLCISSCKLMYSTLS